MVEVTVKAIEQKNNDNYYIVFDYFGRERRTYVSERVREYHHFEGVLPIGTKINVWRTFKSEKEFYMIKSVTFVKQ